MPSSGQRRRRGISMVEVVISSFLIAMLIVSSLETIGATSRGRFENGNMVRGRKLAQGLIDEILQQRYDDEVSPTFGPESGEVTGDRSLFDDVDDYHTWSSSPPESLDGTALNEFDGWERSVSVKWADPADLKVAPKGETGLKKVTVTVKREGVVVAEITTVVTKWWSRDES